MFRLKVESGPREGEEIPLPLAPTAPVSLGRGREVVVRFPDDTTMSRLHAELRWEGGGWVLHNLSQHGTSVDGAAVISACPLRPGQPVVLGETRLRFEGPPAPPGEDPLTPRTPTIASASAAAGYDSQGLFHMGHTLLGTGGGSEFAASFIEVGGRRIKLRSLYFLLVVLLLGLAGCAAMGLLIVAPVARAHPGEFLTATAFGLLPALPYALLIKLLDRNQQIPWRNYLACMLWGGTVGCGFSLVLNAIGGSTLLAFTSAEQARSLGAALLAPVVEEAVKGLGVVVLFWMLHDEFDNVLEGMVLGAASGLGFALVENCFYDVRFLLARGEPDMLVLGTYRAVLNALFGHPVYTAMTGAGLGLLRELPRGRRLRRLVPLGGLAVAILLHVLWNRAALTLGPLLGEGLSVRELVRHTALVAGLGLLFFALAYVSAARRERRVLLTYLGEEVEHGFVEPGELASFRRLFGRERYELEGLLRGGVRAFRERRALRAAQVELAFRKWHLAQGDAPRGRLVDAYVLEARTRIRDARNQLNRLSGRLQAPE